MESKLLRVIFFQGCKLCSMQLSLKTGNCWGQDLYSLVIDHPILALMVVNHRKPKSSEEKVQTHPPASSFCNIVSWILNLFFPSSENSQNVLPFFFYAFGEIISFLASTFFARPRPHPTEFYGKFECETICRRRNLWRGSTLSTGQRCTHSINSELILLLLWVRHFFCTIVPRAWLFTCWRIPLCLSTLEMRLGWLHANNNAKMFFFFHIARWGRPEQLVKDVWESTNLL